MKTNKDLLSEKLQTAATVDDFIKQSTNGSNQCARCSNNYWDGSQNSCHKNTNDSSCEQGYKEWLESYPGENLQVKYHKKYGCVKDPINAYFEKEITLLLYQSKAITLPTRCENCYEKSKCHLTDCTMYYQHILNLHQEYTRNSHKIKNVDSFIEQVLIPKIQDPVKRGHAERLIILKRMLEMQQSIDKARDHSTV